MQPGIAYKKAKVKVTWATLSKRDAYTETLRQILFFRFWKNYEHDFEHLCETASEIMSKNSKKKNYQNNIHHSGGAW